jgi:hypothetical protein
MLFFVLAGCASQASVRSPALEPAGSPNPSGCILLVENRSSSDIHLYALTWERNRVPLGRVRALENLRVRLPKTLRQARYVDLVAAPEGFGNPNVSERVVVEAGTEIVWRLKKKLAFSTLFIR